MIESNKDAVIEIWNNGTGETSATTWLSTSSGFRGTTISDIGGWRDTTQYLALDVNQDGVKDIIEIWNSGGGRTSATVWLSTSSGFKPGTGSFLGVWRDSTKYLVLDANQDGAEDIIEIWNNGGGGATATVWLSANSRFKEGTTSDIGGWRNSTKYLALTSMPTNMQNYAMASKVKSFVPMNKTDDTGFVTIPPIGIWCNSNSLYMGDFNGDGKTDLLCNLGKGENYIMLSYTTPFDDALFASMNPADKSGRMDIGDNYNWCDTSFQRLLIGDFNGDKKSDLLCSNNVNIDQGRIYAMLSNGIEFYPISLSSDGRIDVGINKIFCAMPGRLIVGNFDGIYGDDLLCNDPTLGNMLMVSNINETSKATIFKSVNSKPMGDIIMGNDQKCGAIWCPDPTAKLLPGQFNMDNKTDLLCNLNGSNMIMLSAINSTTNCDFTAVQSSSTSPGPDGYIKIPTINPDIGLSWCEGPMTLKVGDIDGDGLTDLVCNSKGQNKIMLCEFTDSYTNFLSINAAEPEGDGSVRIANHNKWCLSQNIFMGDCTGDSLSDLLCNQNGGIVG